MNQVVSMIILLITLLNGSQKYYINDGPSMSPTINDGDRMVVNTNIPEGISLNDMIVFKIEGKTYVKRVIGVQGDKVEVKKEGIFVNSKLIHKSEDIEMDPAVITLKADEYYVVGDNMNNSYDSRNYGPIKKSQIVGKVTKVQHTQ